MQKHPLDVEETQKQLKTMEPAEEEESIWEKEARRLYVPKADEGWRPWTVQETLLINKRFADAVAKYGAEIFDGDDEERIDIVVYDSADVATATDGEQDDVVDDPADVAAAAKEVQVDVTEDHVDAVATDDPVDVAVTTEDPATEEDPMEEEEDPEEEPTVADQGTGVPEDDANADDPAACPNAEMDASAVSSSNPLPDNL